MGVETSSGQIAGRPDKKLDFSMKWLIIIFLALRPMATEEGKQRYIDRLIGDLIAIREEKIWADMWVLSDLNGHQRKRVKEILKEMQSLAQEIETIKHMRTTNTLIDASA